MRPFLFKVYPDLTPVPLSLDASERGVPALQAIAVSASTTATRQPLDLSLLTRLLYFSAGITKQLRYRPTGVTVPFRAAACTGALYHIELSVVCGDLSGLEAGVYHFDPQGLSLCQLRRGDYRQAVVEASGHEPAVEQAPAILIATDVIWRNAIKYQARAYRHATKGEPRWLRVRITEKAGKHGRVSINLPIGIARSLGDDWPISPGGRCHRDHCPTLGEILRALDSGQSLVESDDDEATVRVWVE